MLTYTEDLTTLAENAVRCMLACTPVEMSLPPGWERPRNFPLPLKRQPPVADGKTIQQYRPMALLEYVQMVLDNQAKGVAVRARKGASVDDDWDYDPDLDGPAEPPTDDDDEL